MTRPPPRPSPWSRLRHPRIFTVDHALYAEEPCEAGEHHVDGLCVVEGAYLGRLPPCDIVSIIELRARLRAGERFLWRGEQLPGVEALRPCACGQGKLLVAPSEREELWPPTQWALERLAADITRFRGWEEELGQRLAAGETSPRVRSQRSMAHWARERSERLLAWIPTAPELSNDLVMLITSIEREAHRAHQRRAQGWMLLSLPLAGIGGWALGRISVRKDMPRR
jgi:hypothetical protein